VPGKDASVGWILSSGAALEVRVGLSVSWAMTSPKFVEIDADLGRRTAPSTRG
jgi:hypothetical protein